MRGRRFLEHTSDVYVEAFGSDLKEAFEEAGLALFETLVRDSNSVSPSERKTVEAEGYDLMSLLYNWLERLLLLFEIERFIGCRVKVEELVGGDAFRVRGEVWGERYDEAKHLPGTHVKSPTYWLMEVISEDGRGLVRFVLDI
ncbi:MAG: archease [Nitrososphaerota archaeon]|nr:archease [Candidatus Calditenuaceae archaeon]MDW8072976.1 archease [Nitrososphaerota archaeon]